MENQSRHLKLSIEESDRLINRIEADHAAAITDHQNRMTRFTRYFKAWRDRIGIESGSKKANFKVPLIKWQTLAKWAKEIDALFGDDAEIVAIPVAPMDEKNVHKISRFMTWLLFSCMKATEEIITFDFYKLIFGKAFAYVPYCIEKDSQGRTIYDAPKFKTLKMDDVIVPNENVCDIEDFSFVIRRYKTRLQDLLTGEQQGLYFGIKDNFQTFYQASIGNPRQDPRTDRIKEISDRFQGVNTTSSSQSMTETLEVWEWYGNWRMLKGKTDDAAEDDFTNRDINETPVLVRYIPDCMEIIGFQKLDDLYPGLTRKRPFVHADLMKDGDTWSPGVAELLEDIEIELTVNHDMATDAGEKASSPFGAYRPASGFAPKKFKLEPGLMVPTDNPRDDLQFYNIQFDPQFSVMREQSLIAIAERVTGITDQAIGRSIDRPNAPRTARGQLALLDEGNIRINLDNVVFREDWTRILGYLWEQVCAFGDEEIFFRVTEEQAKGLFESKDGFASLTKDERAGRMDFQIKFATSVHSREAVKEQKTNIMAALLQLPIVAQNAAAQWLIADDVLKANDLSGMGKYMPRPAPPNYPMTPDEEWALMLQGEDVHPHQGDDHAWHLANHQQQLITAQNSTREKDTDGMMKLITHIQETQEIQAQAIAAAEMQKQMEAGLQQGIGDALQQNPEALAGMMQQQGGGY